jgi:hypothetical protein
VIDRYVTLNELKNAIISHSKEDIWYKSKGLAHEQLPRLALNLDRFSDHESADFQRQHYRNVSSSQWTVNAIIYFRYQNSSISLILMQREQQTAIADPFLLSCLSLWLRHDRDLHIANYTLVIISKIETLELPLQQLNKHNELSS